MAIKGQEEYPTYNAGERVKVYREGGKVTAESQGRGGELITNQEERDAKVRGRKDQHRYERESRQFKKEQDKKRANKEVYYDGVAVKESVVKKAKAGDKKAQREIEAKKWRKKKNK